MGGGGGQRATVIEPAPLSRVIFLQRLGEAATLAQARLTVAVCRRDEWGSREKMASSTSSGDCAHIFISLFWINTMFRNRL